MQKYCSWYSITTKISPRLSLKSPLLFFWWRIQVPPGNNNTRLYIVFMSIKKHPLLFFRHSFLDSAVNEYFFIIHLVLRYKLSICSMEEITWSFTSRFTRSPQKIKHLILEVGCLLINTNVCMYRVIWVSTWIHL